MTRRAVGNLAVQVAAGHPGSARVRSRDGAFAVRRSDYLGICHFDEKRTDGVYCERKRDNGEGFLVARARISRTGVLFYSDGETTWGELRTEADQFEPAAMESFARTIVTDDHPEQWIDAANASMYMRGFGGETVERDGDYLVITIQITDAELIAKIEAGKVELSCGYETMLVPTEGTANGDAYSYRQTEIRGNHVAVVDRGRAGPECRLQLQDGTAVLTHSLTKDQEMKTNKKKDGVVVIEGTEIEVPDEVAAHVLMLEEKLAAGDGDGDGDTAGDGDGDGDGDDGSAVDKGDAGRSNGGGDGRSDAAELAILRRENARLKSGNTDAMGELIDTASFARSVISDINIRGRTIDSIRAEVATSILPDMKSEIAGAITRGDSGFISGMFEYAKKQHDKQAQELDRTSRSLQIVTHDKDGTKRSQDALTVASDSFDEYIKGIVTNSHEELAAGA